MIAKDFHLIQWKSFVKGKFFAIVVRASRRAAASDPTRPSPTSHIY